MSQEDLNVEIPDQFPLMVPSSLMPSMYQCIIHGVGEEIILFFYSL